MSSIAFKPRDSSILVSGSWDNSIKVWHLPSGKCQATFEGHRYTFSAITCMGSLGDPSPVARVRYNVTDNCHGSKVVSCIAFDPKDNDVLVSGSWDKTLKKWRVSSGECLATYTGHR